ncbi:NAD(P)H dehydrogenase [Lactiplantibacillus pentosus]|uniref:NAD(P)H dehydrogenase n=1 Tax=Lactiplantibacillus pentosus TaxID=1589 RepID=A0ABX5CUQ8_LACPE|nr:flavodoxin family protein [Lactiplantibacillus pentosus]PRO89122.1 NAD(P)H dehydrogenase [Lactiplantibacillus pentosus]
MQKRTVLSIVFISILILGGLIIWKEYSDAQARTKEQPQKISRQTFENKRQPNRRALNQQLFINASQNQNGNTAALGRRLLENIKYKQISLVDYHIHQIGQVSANKDQFNVVFKNMKSSKNIIIGTPVYWSDMSGYLKTLFDRMGEHEDGSLRGKNVYLVIQGSDPSDAIIPITHVVKHLSDTFQMNFIGEATTDEQVANLHDKLFQNSR